MKLRWIVLCCAVFAAFVYIKRDEPVRAAQVQPGRQFLIRFGTDGKPEVNWSGSIEMAQATLAPWQFDSKDSFNGTRWTCTTRRETYWDTPYERSMKGTSNREKVTRKGILVSLQPPFTTVRVSTSQGEFSFEPEAALGGGQRPVLGGRATVEAVPASMPLTENADAEDFPSLLEARDGTLWLAYQSFEGKADRLFVRTMRDGKWLAPEAIGEGDIFRTAIAQDAAGRIWVVWSAQQNGNFDLWARTHDGNRWARPERLTSAENADIFHSLAADAKGNLYLAWQSARSGNFDIYLRRYDGKRWSGEMKVSESPAHDWEPVVAVAPSGDATVVWDTYAAGNYDVVARTWSNGKLGPQMAIESSGAFASRASARYDSKGRLWVAFDEGDWNWGKDYGNLVEENGRGLLVRRQVRLAVVDNGRVMEPVAPLAVTVDEDLRQVFQHPDLMFDGSGRPWLLFRTRVNSPRLTGGGTYRAMWRMLGTSWRDGAWAPAFEFADGFGRIDMTAAMAALRDGSVAVVWQTDGRPWPQARPVRQDIRFAKLSASGAPGDIALKPYVPSAENLRASHPDDAGDAARVRAWRATAGGKTYRIVRGDLHRHTDLSWDGNRDGSLDDAYRYALDAAAFDYLGVCDHQGGDSIPYHWWRIQKAVDLFTIKGVFAPLYSYERSLSWPNGHRNVFFATRGRPLLEIPEAERRGKAGAAELYAYLKQFGGLTSSHTSATGAGTDWRDSDAQVEPVVEIYQGYRTNYETPAGPRANKGNEASRYRGGFVDKAWEKGIKMGVQSSSDHVSTHISYGGFYVEAVDRASILAAMQARRTFASTDNMIVETRMGEHFMGSMFSAAAPPPLVVKVRGTRPLAEVEVIRSNKVVYNLPGSGVEAQFTWNDSAPLNGEAWYYVRARQEDGQIVWSSPIWYTRTP